MEETIQLLQECNAGIKMGISSINDVLDTVENEELKNLLITSREHHEKLGDKTHELLNSYHDTGKEPPFMAKTMAEIKTNMKLMSTPTDQKVADIIAEGCDMGIRSVSKYLNQYGDASEEARQIAKELVRIEEELSKELRKYL